VPVVSALASINEVDPRSLRRARAVSTEMGEVRVQFPVPDTYFGM